MRTTVIAAVLAGMLAPAAVAELKPETLAAFESYVAGQEQRIRREEGSSQTFLSLPLVSAAPGEDALALLRRGEVLVEKRGDSPIKVPYGLIHHWVGTALIPDASVDQVVDLVQDYDHLQRYYPSEVEQSRLLARNGDHYRIFLRLRRHYVVSVVLDSEYEVDRGRLDAAHQFSFSRSTRIAEISDPGSPREHALDAQHEHGFLWRLNTYWRFSQAEDGVLVQCEAISLTRGVPGGLGWLIGPLLQSIPRESLETTLRGTRAAVTSELGRSLAESDWDRSEHSIPGGHYGFNR